MKATATSQPNCFAPAFVPVQTKLFREDYMQEISQNRLVVNVAGIRKDQRLTIKEIAALLGVPVSTYAQWEYGSAEPSGAALSLLLIMEARPDVIHEVLGQLSRKKKSVLSPSHPASLSKKAAKVKATPGENTNKDVSDVNIKSST